MHPIYSRSHIRQAVARAMLISPEGGEDGEEAAIQAAAQALGLDVELVREAIDCETEES